MKLNKQQSKALFYLWEYKGQGISYLAFRRSISPMVGVHDTAIVWWENILCGIDPTGWVHS